MDCAIYLLLLLSYGYNIKNWQYAMRYWDILILSKYVLILDFDFRCLRMYASGLMLRDVCRSWINLSLNLILHSFKKPSKFWTPWLVHIPAKPRLSNLYTLYINVCLIYHVYSKRISQYFIILPLHSIKSGVRPNSPYIKKLHEYLS